MQLGITIDMSGPHPKLDMDRVLEAERLGFHQVWTGEAYSTDAVTPVAWILARTTKIKAGTGIMQMPARTPACAAMTVLSLQALSGNRFICGIGPSGPQVVEGWHGVPFGKPMQRTKEYIAIIKQVLAREKPLEFHGDQYDIPYTGPGASGLGRPLRSIAHGNPDVSFFTASITPAGLRTAGEVADGNLPIFFSPDAPEVVTGPTLEGRKKAGKTMAGFDNAPFVRAKMGPDIAACRDAIRPELALYIGGMGARSKNFYNDMVSKMGFEADAKVIQDLYLDGKKTEAAAKVPDKLIDAISLVGPAEMIRDRLQAWKAVARDGHVGTMVLKGASVDVMRVVAEAVL
ncbi:LLM class F420-dependent oxidoreductase [Rhodopila sp.]|jgi:F420-dependent oxidoreductase-like protein|uniref:LLM class F420-dependent oxidoreductase n=1 Tax=Rhodopila sp. TaxID=2480087 RepID=UPI002CD80F37|nr:LLM class F420-dependent oxidoreductase [Rhodopila sp.]HVZ06540.1 LLM class F420-dependent oxidoreductase [Rhodopila sp.]